MVAAEEEKSRGGARRERRMLINDERSRDVYENKRKDDNFTEKKGDIPTQLNDFLHKNRRILLKSSVFCHFWSAGNEFRASKCSESRSPNALRSFNCV